VTRLLVEWKNGNSNARDLLTPIVYNELRRLAAGYLRNEREAATLQPTALVHEVYLRLVGQNLPDWESRSHFFGVAAQMMRRILVDFARQRPRVDKDNAALPISLDDAMTISSEKDSDLLALDEALRSLSEIDERKGKIVELRFFGGLSVDETAEVMKVAPITVIREWNKAKAWLYRELTSK
jgi:RNA polymerase sigma factor (TIGR02999 family)